MLFKFWLVDSQRLTTLGGAVHDDRLFINIVMAQI